MRDCINKLEDLINYAGELGHKVIGITDHESTSGWLKATKIAQKAKEKYPNLKVILGNEIYLCRNGLNANNFNKDNDKYYHFCIYAKDRIGAKQIMELSTRAWNRSYMARGMRRVPTYYSDIIEIIGGNPGHVIGSTACLGGALPTQILKAKNNIALEPKIENWIIQMDSIFGHGNFYLEMQPSNNKEQIVVNKKLLEYSNNFSIPYIITTDSHYLKKEDRLVHKAYLNSQNGDREVDDFYATTYLMDTEEIESYFSYFNDEIIQKAYKNIIEISEKCEDIKLEKSLHIPELKWKYHPEVKDKETWIKRIPYLEKFWSSPDRCDNLLADALIDGINIHTDLCNEEAYKELNENLEATWISSNVNKAHWSSYYLNMQNIIDICWNAGSIVGPARGSGGGFLLLYALDIIQINPLRETTKCYGWRLTQRV